MTGLGIEPSIADFVVRPTDQLDTQITQTTAWLNLFEVAMLLLFGCQCVSGNVLPRLGQSLGWSDKNICICHIRLLSLSY